jgi:hypothetical protein
MQGLVNGYQSSIEKGPRTQLDWPRQHTIPLTDHPIGEEERRGEGERIGEELACA